VPLGADTAIARQVVPDRLLPALGGGKRQAGQHGALQMVARCVELGALRVLLDVVLHPVRIAAIAVRRVDIHPVALELLEQGELARRQLVGIFVDVGRIDRQERLFILVLPEVATEFSMAPPCLGHVATGKCRNRTIRARPAFCPRDRLCP